MTIKSPDIAHESGHNHVTGKAVYIDDIPEPAGCLHAAFGLSTCARGEITRFDLDAVRKATGVVCVLTHADITGANDISPVGAGDEPVFPETRVSFYGQPLFAVIATTRDQARRAARLADITYADAPPAIDILDADGEAPDLVTTPLVLERGHADTAFAQSPHKLSGRLRVGGQDHFYLEGQIAMALPGEDKQVILYASTQHPSEIQHMVAHVLGTASHDIRVESRRMGGGFGGKETQGNIFAVTAALAARKTGRAVKIRPDRDDDMIMTGKRHDFLMDYHVGFDDKGLIHAVKGRLAARCGYSADLSGPITDRALFHADNAYFYPHVSLTSVPLRTNTVSNTAFRGFGGPQGVAMAEKMIEEIARTVDRDPLDIRLDNLYGEHGDLTPYHQTVEDNVAGRILRELADVCDYRARREDIRAFNAQNRFKKRGIALTPVKFGISFTATWYNQAGALVHLYRDGSILVNHGGTEMGQGLYTKVAQVVADAFAVPFDRVRVSATDTTKVPNTSATAASSGSDLNGKAAEDACEQIKSRLAAHFGVMPAFAHGGVSVNGQTMSFAEMCEAAYLARVQLSAAGFYKTPEIHWDRKTGRGQPFYYFAYGAACSEVEIDRFTGDYTVLRTDILHDVGRSLNGAIDLGQVEGGFIQGMGWLTREELWWDHDGRLRTHAPSTYKIPLASDIPRIFKTKLVDWNENKKPTIKRSKAVGEPPFMLATSVFCALDDAIYAISGPVQTGLDAPATPERVLMAMDARDGGI